MDSLLVYTFDKLNDLKMCNKYLIKYNNYKKYNNSNI